MKKLTYIDFVTFKILALAVLTAIAIPYYFIAGGTILGFVAVRLIGHAFGMFSQIGSHRWLSHNSFEPSVLGKYLMMFGLLSSGFGRPLHLVIAHRLHHAHSDQDLDPHSPKHHSWVNLWLGRFSVKEGIRPPKDFYRRKDVVWFNDNYWALFFAFNLVLAIVDFKTALIYCPINFTWGWIMATVINWNAHVAPDGTIAPRNLSTVWVWLTAGEGLHKNHHDYPVDYKFGHGDPYVPLIERVLMK